MKFVSNSIDFIDLTSADFDVTSQLEDGTIVVIQAKGPGTEHLAALLRGVTLSADDRVVVATLAPDVAAQVAQFAQLAVHNKQMTERLVSAMFTQHTVSPAAAQQAQRNAEARQELIDEFGLFESEQLAQLVGSKAKNRSATASRWLAEGRVFAVEHLGHRYFPAFQFGADSRPKPIIHRILEVFEPYGLNGWEIALWFTTTTGWLDDQRPVDRLAATPDDVVIAAQRTFGEVAA